MTLALFTCCLFLQSLTPEVIEHAQVGAAAQQQGRLDVAIQEFRRVTELQPGSAAGHANLGDAYFQHGEYGAAISELELALRLNPNLMGAHQTLGVALLVQGNPEGALPHLEKAHTPELLGLAYLETGRLGSAITALQAALDRQPNDPDLLYYFGRATALASKRTFDQLAEVNPDLARKSVAAADSENLPPQDVVNLQKALAKQPNDADLLFAFSRAAALASRKAFDRILQSSANPARAHQVLAERYLESGRLPEAEREYAESLRLKPYTSNVHLALGNVFAADGNWSAAVAQFRMESELRPASADAFYRLGSVLLQQGQARGAVEELAHADRLSPDTPQILLALGRAAFAANDAARAEASWIKLLGIDKEGDLAAAAHSGLATLYRRAGRSQEADREMAAYERLLKSQGGR
jgi:tetratricopeptide (TPR) repeat protein